MSAASNRCWLGMGLALVAAATGSARSGGELARALSSDGIEIGDILHHEFRDLDGDGVKETVVHGTGNMRSASVGEALVLYFQGEQPAVAGQAVFLPSSLAWDRFVGVFRFDRSSFRWIPVLLGTYRREQVEVTELGVVEVGETPMVRLSYEAEGRVQDRLYRVGPDGASLAFSGERGTWVGEGFWLRGTKLFTSLGIPDPFRVEGGPRGPFVPKMDRPGLMAKTRYRWRDGRFQAEFWTLGGYGTARSWGPDNPARPTGEAARKVDEMQRAADRGLSTTRLSLEDLCQRQFGDQPFRIVHTVGGYGVVVQDVNRRPVAQYFLRPYHRLRKPGMAAWVGLDELTVQASRRPNRGDR